MNVETGTIVHAYGVIPGGAAVDLPKTGMGGSDVALLDAGPVAAVFSILPEPEFGDAVWHAHADDARWLAKVALEHQNVLGALIEGTDVLPLRLPGMYRDETHLHGMLEAEAPLFRAALDAVHDHVEWSVQMFLHGEPEQVASRPTSGREYFKQKSDAATRRELERARREERVREAYAVLAGIARQSAINLPQDPALTGRREPMLLNSAHLVSRRHERLFFAAVEEAAARSAALGVTVEVSGPWPPYNFVELGVDNLEAQP